MGEGRFEDRRQDRSRFMAERGAPSYRQKEQAPVLPGDRICPQCNFHNFKGKFGECLCPLLLIPKCADPWRRFRKIGDMSGRQFCHMWTPDDGALAHNKCVIASMLLCTQCTDLGSTSCRHCTVRSNIKYGAFKAPWRPLHRADRTTCDALSHMHSSRHYK